MHMKTLLNYMSNFKGFVYQHPKLHREKSKLTAEVVARKSSKPVCSCCGNTGSIYDHLPQRKFLLPPIWNIMVVLLYSMRRVDCRCNRVVVEQVPWATG